MRRVYSYDSRSRVPVVRGAANNDRKRAKIAALREETKAQVVGAFALVDRLQGGREKLAAEGVTLHAVFTRKDFD